MSNKTTSTSKLENVKNAKNDPKFITFAPIDRTPDPRDSATLYDRIPKGDGKGDRIIRPPMPKSMSSPMKPSDKPEKPSPKKFVSGNKK